MFILAQNTVLGYVLSVVFGGACGLLPLYVAKRRGRSVYGVVSVILCAIAGFLAGLIGAIPLALLLTAVVAILGQAKSGT